MKLDYVPLLRVQRELQGLPRNYARFQRYLDTMLNREGMELPPLGVMNPMGKDHVTVLLVALLAMDADGIGAQAAAEASAALPDVPGEIKVALGVADDLMGAWTNRYDWEFGLRFGDGRPVPRDPDAPSGFQLPRWLEDFWLTGVLWSGEPPSERAAREALLLPAYRLAHVDRHGPGHDIDGAGR